MTETVLKMHSLLSVVLKLAWTDPAYAFMATATVLIHKFIAPSFFPNETTRNYKRWNNKNVHY